MSEKSEEAGVYSTKDRLKMLKDSILDAINTINRYINPKSEIKKIIGYFDKIKITEIINKEEIVKVLLELEIKKKTIPFERKLKKAYEGFKGRIDVCKEEYKTLKDETNEEKKQNTKGFIIAAQIEILNKLIILEKIISKLIIKEIATGKK